MSERKNIERYIQEHSQSYKDIKYLTDMDLQEYHDEQNKVVQAFLNGLKKKESSTSTSSNTYRAAKAVEGVLNYAHVNIVLPLHFKESLCVTK